MRRLRPRAVFTLIGLLLLVVPPVAWWATRQAVDVGDLVDAPSAQTDPSPTPSSEQATGPKLPRRSGLLSQQPDPSPTVAPTSLRAAAIGVEAGIVPVGIDPSGAMEIPSYVDEVGWYRFGPVPGEPGTAVLAGHVDSRTQGRGAFFDLRRLDVGDLVVVETEGSTSTWEVVARRQYGKDVIPLDEVFTRDGPTRLALITCGGEFDRDAGRYLENIVVYAVPVP